MTDADDRVDDAIRAAVHAIVLTSPEPPPLPSRAAPVVVAPRASRAGRARWMSALTALAVVLALVAALGVVVATRHDHRIASAHSGWTTTPEPPALPANRIVTPQFVAIGARALLLAADTTPGHGYMLRGYLYSPDANRWSATPASPRMAHVPGMAFWTGREVVVLGGVNASGVTDPPLLYDPARARWSSGTPAPARASAAENGLYPAVWDGHEIVMPGQALAYDPERDRWRTIPPTPLQGRYYAVAVWSGREVLVWGGCSVVCDATAREGSPSDAAAYDPARGTWRMLPRSPLVLRSGVHGAFVDGRFFLWGGYVAGADGYGATFDPSTNQWTPIPAAPITRRARFGIAVLRERVVIWGGHDATGTSGALRADGATYDVRTRQWRLLPPSPLSPREYPSMTSISGVAVVWGGDSAQSPGSTPPPLLHDGALYKP